MALAYSFNPNFISYSSTNPVINHSFLRIQPPICDLAPFSKDLFGRSLCLLSDHNKGLTKLGSSRFTIHAQASDCVTKSLQWWKKALKPNMIEINSAQQLVDSLLNAGDRLVIVGFYSPGCGGCKSLHPKICQLAESNSDALFLKINYDELKPMCNCLHVHVLPFFRLYRGAQGKVCSFSCTIATIKKFKDALAKHGMDRCSSGPAKGLEESELLNLAAIGQISQNSPEKESDKSEDLVLKCTDLSNGLFIECNTIGLTEENSLTIA